MESALPLKSPLPEGAGPWAVAPWLVLSIAVTWAIKIKGEAARVEGELRHDLRVKEKSRLDERAGRIRLEKELRRRMEEDLVSTDGGTFVHRIGTIVSCFKTCVGTPRQGLLTPAARARLVLEPRVSPASLDDLQGFSHLWITFIFHLNTNTNRNYKALTKSPGQTAHTFPAKITPPMLKRRVGIFSTRSPHRPNPIGVTLARIEHVCPASRTIHLSAVDLVDGTPVLDVKPYVPLYDTVPEGWHVPQWIQEGIGARRTVIIPPEVAESVEGDQLSLYKGDPGDFLCLVKEVLAVDVRSPHQQEGDRSAKIRLDTMVVEYRLVVHDGDSINVRVEAVRKWRRGAEDEGNEEDIGKEAAP